MFLSYVPFGTEPLLVNTEYKTETETLPERESETNKVRDGPKDTGPYFFLVCAVSAVQSTTNSLGAISFVHSQLRPRECTRRLSMRTCLSCDREVHSQMACSSDQQVRSDEQSNLGIQTSLYSDVVGALNFREQN